MKKSTIFIAVTITIGFYLQFHSTVKKVASQPQTYIKYTIKPGDTLSQIALKFKPKGEDFSNYISTIQFQNNINSINDITAGKEIYIPVE